jgi:hypothetical protein
VTLVECRGDTVQACYAGGSQLGDDRGKVNSLRNCAGCARLVGDARAAVAHVATDWHCGSLRARLLRPISARICAFVGVAAMRVNKFLFRAVLFSSRSAIDGPPLAALAR